MKMIDGAVAVRRLVSTGSQEWAQGTGPKPPKVSATKLCNGNYFVFILTFAVIMT